MKSKVKVEGMSCGHCAMRVKDALESVPGVSDAKVNHKKGAAVINQSENVVFDDLKKVVDETGYTLVEE